MHYDEIKYLPDDRFEQKGSKSDVSLCRHRSAALEKGSFKGEAEQRHECHKGQANHSEHAVPIGLKAIVHTYTSHQTLAS